MKSEYFSRRNLNFTLYEVLDVLSLTKHPYFSAHDVETFEMTLDTATRIAEKIMRPAYVESDRQQPELINGELKVHPAIRTYYEAYCESGLLSSAFDYEKNGQQIPRTIYAAVDFIVGNAHNGFEMFTGLSGGAARLINSFASEKIMEAYLPKILSGEWTATMCLTETQAGSSLSDVATKAFGQDDGTYRIKGQKIFISAGDHDVTPNIVHLVLARIEGSPIGMKGVSLFVVPKKRRGKNDELEDNDVVSVSIYHKMGQTSTPAMHLEFGAKDDCLGELIGEPGKGIKYMFQMMNAARLGVGLAGTYIASAAYYASLKYANERIQGRRLNQKESGGSPVAIINHPDVRRMLLHQKVFVEGTLAFILQCYKYFDLEKVTESNDLKEKYNDLLELLTPVAKTYGAEMGLVSVNYGIQVLGGYGYTKDFILEQLARDVRIMSVYEGTTGIQSQALLGRQVPMNNGRSLQFWKDEVMADLNAAQNFSTLQCYSDWLLNEIRDFSKVTAHLLQLSAKGEGELFLADATLYMELFGILNLAWQWLKQGVVAEERLGRGVDSKEDMLFYKSKLKSMKFFFHYELRKTKALTARLTDSEVITIAEDEELII